MHIHQGHWSLSSSAWWTLLCNNQLIYILPSTAICVDYWEKAQCVCDARATSYVHTLSSFFLHVTWWHVFSSQYWTHQQICTDMWGAFMHMYLECDWTGPGFVHVCVWLHVCAWSTPISPCSPVPPPPFSLVGSSWHRSWVVNPPGLPDCALLKTRGPPYLLPVSAGQSLKAARCDGTDWQLGSHARGYQRSVSRERAPSHGLA